MWVYPEIRTLGDYTRYWAKHDPHRIALKFRERAIDFAQFDRACNRAANFLLGRGVSAGGRIGFLGKNSFDFYFALFGCVRAKTGMAVLNWRLRAPELSAQVEDCEPGLVIIEQEFLALWEAACTHLPRIPDIVVIAPDESFETLIASCDGAHPEIEIDEEDVAILLYTSGTTGRPKGVMLTHKSANLMRLSEHLEPAFAWRRDDSFVNGLPNFHLLHLGITLQCLYNGVSITIVRQFAVEDMLEAIDRERPTLLTLTPTMLQMILDDPGAATCDFSSLRLILYAGSPISLKLIKRAIAAMPCQFMQFYGSTESGGASSILRPEEHDLADEARLQSCGRPLPLIEFRIVDAEGAVVAQGEAGELLIRQPSITKGYWRQQDATAAVIKDGWYRSGDIVRQDAQGLYYIVDRAKDMIVSGGENVYSAEIERVLSTHPDVSAVAVIGVPDERWGEAVKAIVIPNGDNHDEAGLIAFCRVRLAAYKVPKSVDFVDAFPFVPSGKVAKKVLRDRYWGENQRGVG